MDDNELLYKLALSITPGIGSVLARNLVNHVGNVKGIFRESVSQLTRIPGIGDVNARNIKEKEVLIKAEKEMEFVKRHGITVLFYQDEDFPRRFRDCPDAPVTCFFKGGANLDAQKTVAIVGTRHATDYGRQVCDTFIKELAEKGHDLLIISGLAYGIDIQAHNSALKYDIPTIGVLGHGLDKMYPTVHAKTARSMLTTGGLLTDFPSNTKIDPANFIRRNRLIAGLSDATVVIESGDKGGALITAEIAASYHRDVFAFPGRATDRYSKGCNKLIQNNIAALIESADDLELLMGWEKRPLKRIPVQQELFPDLNEEEKVLVEQLQGEEKSYIDTLCFLTGIPVNRVSPILLGLEFKGVIEALPGNMYRLR